MKILFDMGHPAHVHFFKNAIWELEKRGHQVKVTAREKDVTLELLGAYKIPYVVRGRLSTGEPVATETLPGREPSVSGVN